jgi:hypothetical protein
VRKHFRYLLGSIDLLFVTGTLRTPGVAAMSVYVRVWNGAAGLPGRALVDQRAEGRELVVK